MVMLNIYIYTASASDVVSPALITYMVQQWPCNEKSQCWPWYLPQPHIIADINK